MSEVIREGLAAEFVKMRRDIRRLTWLVFLALLVPSGVVLLAPTSPAGDVEASRLLIRDSAGRVRARLEMINDAPRLSLIDAHGLVGVELGMQMGQEVHAESLGTSTSDSESARIRLRERSYLQLLDPKGRPRVTVQVAQPGFATGLIISGSNGRTVWETPNGTGAQ